MAEEKDQKQDVIAVADSNSIKDDDDTKSEKKEKEGNFGDFIRIFRYADGLSAALYIIAALGAIVVGATLPVMTIFFGSSTSSLNTYASGQSDAGAFQANINHLVLYFVYIFVARFVISYVAILSICTAAARTTTALRKAFLQSLLRQEVSYFDQSDRGSAATQASSNGNRINQGIAEKLYTATMGISLFFSSYIVALAVQWKLALITMSIVPVIVIVMGGCVSLLAPIESKTTKIYSQAANLAQDAIGSIKTLHAFGAQDKVIAWYDEYLARAHKEGDKKSILFGIVFGIQTFLVMCGTALAFWEGHRLYASGEIPNVGTVFTVVLSVTLGTSSTLLVIPQFFAFTDASGAAGELFTIIDRPSQLDPLSTEGKQPANLDGEIEIRNLSFAYPTRPGASILQDMNLSMPAGKTTALVGPSGCGKSTVVGLLERWYQPSSGSILLDGLDLSEYNTKWLRSKIRLVQQEPTLFQGTVFENVAKGLVDEQLSLSHDEQMKLVRKACISADAHDFIERLPSGYHTELGERANMLSGGQRQRVSIARSIVSDPKILLFDEATSALDPRAEKTVQAALDRVSSNKTTLIIAHKLATVMAADNIAVMQQGKIVEQGMHRDLIELDGLYAAMVRAQDLGTADQEKSEYVEDDTTDEKDEEPLTLQRTKSKAAQVEESEEALTAGTLNYSLAKCVWIMLKEHPDLYIWYAIIAIVDIVLAGTYPGQAIVFSHLIYVFTLQGDEAQQQANLYALLFFVIALANLLGYFGVGWATNTISQVLTHRYRYEMVQRMFYFDQDFFDRPQNNSGALTARLSSVPSALQELMSANLGLMVNIVANIIACSVVAIAFGWQLGLTLTFAGLALIVAGGYVRIRLDQQLEAATEYQYTDSARLASEAVNSIRTVSLLTLESSTLDEYSMVLDRIVKKVVRNFLFTLLPYAFSQAVEFLVLALGFWYGSRLIATGVYTTSQFFVVFIVAVFGANNIAQFLQYTSSITKAGGAANYILWLRTVSPDIRATEDNKDKGPPQGDAPVDMENVEFQYKQRDSAKVLRDISINIKPGTLVAFVGPSGCGKSTLVSLVERFYDPTSGRITLGGTDISTYSPHLYRKHMSLVQQEPPLYMGSVRLNISLGLDYEPSEEELLEACRKANAHDFITSLPEGLETLCGQRGNQFSGGQRQRIAVARALIRNPHLLLLDEATSALDSQSERVVQEALASASSGRTTISVAHRLSTIKHADQIFVIEDGKIAEAGTHEALQQMRGRYYAMCLAQSLDQA